MKELSQSRSAIYVRNLMRKIALGDPSVAKSTVKLTCIFCKKDFTTRKWRAKQQHCSKSCLHDHRRQDPTLHPHWKGGVTKGCGYKYLYVGGEKNGYTRLHRAEHILKAERVLRRRLKRGEVVHHINGNKQDNRNSNLLICTASYHRWLHNHMSELYAREKFGHL